MRRGINLIKKFTGTFCYNFSNGYMREVAKINFILKYILFRVCLTTHKPYALKRFTDDFITSNFGPGDGKFKTTFIS